ncbi:AMP-binding protein [Cytobacillus kochii]|uniref:class I adenylate-forming enzyme family protein n=1 Tax=Cytobacillus kochii TaxID=859143 RepID=UPI00384EBAA7
MSIETIQGYMNKALKRFEEHPAVTFMSTNEILTYRELRKEIDKIASFLVHLGVKKGSHVAYLIPNSIEFVLFSQAVARCGATSIPMGVKLGVREVDFILNDSDTDFVIMATEMHMKTVLKYVNDKKEQHQSVKVIGLADFNLQYPEEFTTVSRQEIQKVENVSSFPDMLPEDISMISYTGGTTGRPKGVMHSQGGKAAALIASFIEFPMDDRDKVLLTTPLQHSAGSLMLRALAGGAHIYIDTFKPDTFLKTVQDKKITVTFTVPTIIYRIIDKAKKVKFDVSSLRSIHYGSSPISSERLKEAMELFGPVFVQQYGATEANVLITRMHKFDHVRALETGAKFLQSCGKPCLMTEIRIIDEEGQDVKAYEKGEVILKSPYLMEGYYKRPDLTLEAIKDGWFHTGDIGQFDEEGFLYIVDRKKDMIISGGMNVYSVEVEKVVNQHPAVVMSACIGVPDPDWGELVTVFVVLRDGEKCSEEEIIEFCKARTSSYMVPKKIYFKENLPLTQIGKIDKKELKKDFWKDKERQIN